MSSKMIVNLEDDYDIAEAMLKTLQRLHFVGNFQLRPAIPKFVWNTKYVKDGMFLNPHNNRLYNLSFFDVRHNFNNYRHKYDYRVILKQR